MAVSRVDFAGRTLMDITGDTVIAPALLAGYTAHSADGEQISGALREMTSAEVLAAVEAAFANGEQEP